MPLEGSPLEPPAPSRTRRPHRKSRNGCSMCKIRKVKCNEEKPACLNCVRFGLVCSFGTTRITADSHSEPIPICPPPAVNSVPSRRSRGRPRKNWTNNRSGGGSTSRDVDMSQSPSTNSPTPTNISTPAPSETSSSDCPWDTSDAELSLQFVSATARTFCGDAPHDDPILKFWSVNVPQIGLRHHFVLHFSLAIAGHHLSRLRVNEGKAQYYTMLADRHAAAGLSGFTTAVTSPTAENVGALYVSATLVCYCSFATGPTGPDDLLVCKLDDNSSGPYPLLIHGVRLIRELIDSQTLFSGLMEPLGPKSDDEPEPEPNPTPAYLTEGFPRLDWERPVSEVRHLIATSEDPDATVCLKAFDALTTIYEANYGDSNGKCSGSPNDVHVFGWLYRMQIPFQASLQRNNPLSLLILAYFAVLFKVVHKCWFMDGWMEHIIPRINERLGDEYSQWMQWPMSQVKDNRASQDVSKEPYTAP
ncbi:hypothetical protein F4810DRAFT_717721 [Camillea tinctor]|nr:hypothetical protein F4810DRAFT_717721 [Camillea tinctor]